MKQSCTQSPVQSPLQSPLHLLGDLLVAEYTHIHTHECTHSYIKYVSNIYVVSIYAHMHEQALLYELA